jgi:MoaA/NifB/PqqE/SkfB family radical SAM enzyme
MRYLRLLANSILRGGLNALNGAPQPAMQRAIESVVRLLAPLDNTLLQEPHGAALIAGMRIVAEAIITTPYGQALKFPAPLLITVGPSSFCPYACSNCYSSSGREGQSPSHQRSLAIFTRIAKSRSPFVMISGGEPLSMSNINAYIEMLLDARKFVYLATNASIRPLTSLLREHRSHLFVFLSLWGDQARHDQIRGSGSYDRLKRNLSTLNGFGLPGRLLVVLSDCDFSIFDAVDEIVRSSKVRTVIVLRKLSIGRYEKSAFAITTDFVARLRHRVNTIRPHVNELYFDIPEFRGLDDAKRPSRFHNLLGIAAHDECSAGNWMMHLDADGGAFPCYSFEGRSDIRCDSDLSIEDQWALVGAARRNIKARSACIGEALVGNEG